MLFKGVNYRNALVFPDRKIHELYTFCESYNSELPKVNKNTEMETF